MQNPAKKQNIRSKILLTILALIILTAGGLGYWSWQQDHYSSILVDVDQKHPTDRRTFRTFTLPNELEVLLISDPDATQSSAALDVDAGHLANPLEHLGMAHFLEHMLFLGSEKYPKEGEYQEYISQNGGDRNGSTFSDHTTYYFTVNHDAFTGGLDRFSQFFIAPLFKEEFVEREKGAVESEFQLRLQEDSRRIWETTKSLMKKDHPLTRFSIGNGETLKNVTRQNLIDFYRQTYTANQMKLALLSNASLNEQEKLVRTYFSAIPNNHRERSHYDSTIYEKDALPRFVQIKPLRNTKSLDLTFVTPSYLENWKSWPNNFINYLMTYAGENSFVSYLKKQDLVTSVSSGFDELPFVTTYSISFNLTDLGAKDPQKIIGLFFGYVNYLKQTGLKKYLFEEKKKMTELSYAYRSHEEGSGVVDSLACYMWNFKPLEIEKKTSLFYNFDPKTFMTFMEALSPHNLDAIFVAPDVTTDKTEPIFKTDYAVRKYTPDEINVFNNAAIDAAVQYPAANPYIPDKLTEWHNDEHATPYKLIDDNRGEFWFMQDKKVLLPKAMISVLIRNEAVNVTPRAMLVSNLYTNAFAKSYERWVEPFGFAGLGYEISRENRGIELFVSGFSEKLPEFTKDLITRLQTITIDETEFEAIKTLYQRSYDNFDLGRASVQSAYHRDNILSKHTFHRDEFVNLLGSITLDEIKSFAKEAFKTIAVQGEAYGNLDPQSLQDITAFLFTTCAANILPKEKWINNRVIKIPEGQPRVYSRTSRDNNYGWSLFIPIGPRTAQNKAITGLLRDYLQPAFFNEMRTHRQYGYSLNVSSDFYRDVVGLNAYILAPKHDATYLDQQALDWLKEQAKTLDQIPADQLDTLKQSLITLLEQEDKTISEWFDYVDSVAYYENGDPDYRSKHIEALKQITAADLQATLTKALAPETTNYLTVHISPQIRPSPTPAETPIFDIEAFKKDAEVW